MRISARNVLAATALAALAVGAASGLGEFPPGWGQQVLGRDSSGGGFWDLTGLAPFLLEMAMPAIGEQLEICLA